MEKGYFSIKKVVKNLRNYSNFPIAVISCPAAAHMYR